MTQTKHLLDEADIGSGEKNSGDRENEKEIQKIKNPGKRRSSEDAEKRKGLVDETHPFPPKGN